MPYYDIILRILLACILGGIVGGERELENKNAGFRTHILVCVASTLIMLTSEFIFQQYHNAVNIDPARLGAQVVSGIGFLGAGAIIKNGPITTGLTTAASLWAVSGIGLACGIGFYIGAISTTMFMIAVLVVFRKIEKVIVKHRLWWNATIVTVDRPGLLEKIISIFTKQDISIRGVKVEAFEEDTVSIDFSLKSKMTLNKKKIMEDIMKVEGIYSISDSTYTS